MSATGRAERRNVVLVTVDAWRADFVDAHAGVALTPSLAAVADRTVRFDAAYANGPWTSPGLVSLFTGESPARHRVHYEWSRPRTGGPAVAATLAAAGFDVPNLCYLNRVGNYANLGYDPAGAPDYPHDPDDDLLVPALRALRDRRAPAFLWFHYKFVHLPYWAGASYRRALGVDDAAIHPRLRASVCQGFVVPRGQFRLEPDEDRAMVRRLYAAGVLQMNEWLGRVLEELDHGDGALGARTALVITADHGEELLDHGHVGHASTAHHATLHEEVLRIPLLIVDARARGGARCVPARVQQVDLFPTLLSLAGVAPPAGGPGVDLAPLVLGAGRGGGAAAAGAAAAGAAAAAPDPARPFLFQSARMGYLTPRTHEGQEIEALSDGTRKIVVERYDESRTLLYDLAHDPGETAPLDAGPALDDARAWLDRTRSALANSGPRATLEE